jgi:hypothetical protein
MPGRSPAIAVLGGVLLLAACAPRRPPWPAPPDRAQADVLLARLAARRDAVGSLRARARVKAGLAALWTHEALLVRRPDCLRIDVLSPFGLALAVGARGPLLWAYPPAERTRYEGPSTPENLQRFLGAAVTVPDVVDVLLGGPPARRPVAPATVASEPDGRARLTVPLADGVQTVWFAPGTLDVVAAEEAHSDGEALRVAFDEHRDGFPRMITVASTASGAEARLAYEDVEVNAPVDTALCAPPPAGRVLPIAAAPG